MKELKEYFEKRIAELNDADAKFCEMRWDLNRPQLERNLYREASNEVTGRRRELEDAQTFFNNLLKPDVSGQSEQFCEHCGKQKRMSGTGVIKPLCECNI